MFFLTSPRSVVGRLRLRVIFWCSSLYRRRANRDRAQFNGNPPFEILYVVVPS